MAPLSCRRYRAGGGRPLGAAMTGMFMGMSKSFTATVDRSPAEIMILPPKAESSSAMPGSRDA